jgi:uncharacterized protein
MKSIDGHESDRIKIVQVTGRNMAALAILIGLLTGALSGLIGLGGGVFIVPALVYLFKMPQRMAQGTSLATLLLPIGLLGVWEYYRAGHVDVRVAAFIAFGFVIGVYAGGRWAQEVPEMILRRVFAVTLVVVAVRMWFDS